MKWQLKKSNNQANDSKITWQIRRKLELKTESWKKGHESPSDSVT